MRVKPPLDNSVGLLFRDDLDLDASLARDHDYGASLGAVDDDGCVILALDVHSFRHQELVDLQPFRSGLRRDHTIAEHEGSSFADLISRLAKLDEPSLPPAAGEDLGLDDHLGTDLLMGFDRLLDGLDHLGSRNGHPGFCQ